MAWYESAKMIYRYHCRAVRHEPTMLEVHVQGTRDGWAYQQRWIGTHAEWVYVCLNIGVTLRASLPGTLTRFEDRLLRGAQQEVASAPLAKGPRKLSPTSRTISSTLSPGFQPLGNGYGRITDEGLTVL